MDADLPDGPGPVDPDPVVDWRDAVLHASPPPALTTVGPRFAVVHEGGRVRRYDDLEPDTVHELEGFAFQTLPEPGELLATFVTVNDVHFGEEVCGQITGEDIGPTFRSEPGEDPYPEVMNRAAVAEMAAVAADAVLVKGDLTSNGTVEEYDAFRAVYEPAFGERLHVVRGNHESYNHATFAADPVQRVDLPGVTLLLIDTSVDGSPAGTVRPEQLDEIDSVAAGAERPVLLFGHHHVGDRHSREKADRTFGIDIDASDALVALVALLLIDWRITLAALAVAALPGFGLDFAHRKMRPLFRQRAEQRTLDRSALERAELRAGHRSGPRGRGACP